MNRRLLSRVAPSVLCTWVTLAGAGAQDWPTYRHDAQRSGTSPVSLDAARLEEAWTVDTGAAPRPAWPGPARWDAYAGVRGLRSMRNYDPVHHVTVAGERWFYGSTVDGAVVCRSTQEGRELWRFPTGGPVRIAPTVEDQRVFFGSDDGFAYCVDAESGAEIWRTQPVPCSRGVIHEGRRISFWPVRTGVLVEDGVAWFGASLFPWKDSFLCAVDALDGHSELELGPPAPREFPTDHWSSISNTDSWDRASGGTLNEFDGFAWYRCRVQWPPEWEHQELRLHLGRVDDCDQTYFDGQLVGATGRMPPEAFESAYTLEREYVVPAALVQGDGATIAVLVFDGGGSGGFQGDAVWLACGEERLSLDGSWQFRPDADRRLADPQFTEPSIVDPQLGAPGELEVEVEATETLPTFPQEEPPFRPFVRRQVEQTMEGALLLSDSAVIVPQGRVAPLLYSRYDGRSLGSLTGGGGVFVVVTEDHHVLHGPGHKTGWITDSEATGRSKVASFEQGNALVVSGHWAFLMTDAGVAGIDRSDRRVVWQTKVETPLELILAGDTLFVGREDAVLALRAQDGALTWSARVQGRAFGLAVADDALFVSTDEGRFHCFRPTATKAMALPEITAGAGPSTEALPESPRVPTGRMDGRIARWVFHRSVMSGEMDGARLKGVKIPDLVGSRPARLVGEARVQHYGEVESLVLEGQSSVRIRDDEDGASLPATRFSAEAWAKIDVAQEWGGLIGVVQDNGDFEQGWLLGYRDRRFSFTLTGSDATRPGDGLGDSRMTCLQDPNPFSLGSWHHVVGTYDGRTLRLYVDGRFVAESDQELGAVQFAPSAFFEIGAYHDQDEYFPMRGELHEVTLFGDVLREREVRARFESLRESFPQATGTATAHRLAMGPRLRFTGPSTAEVQWETSESVPSELEYGLDERSERIFDAAPRTHHRVRLEGLRSRRVYHYQIVDRVAGEERRTESYECDTHFADFGNFPRDTEPSEWARALEERAPELGGLVLAVGPYAAEILSQLDARRFTLHTADIDAASELPFPSRVFDLVLAPAELGALPEGALRRTEAELLRVTRPRGGVVLLVDRPTENGATSSASGSLDHWCRTLGSDWSADRLAGHSASILRRGTLPGEGLWSHQYGLPDNSSYGHEALQGVHRTDDLEVQWFGPPGPRYQSDRQNRKPSPLAVNGRLFLQGLQRILALDAYNGTALWSWELPRLARFNVPRDCSNWCADERHVFAAIDGRCVVFDGRSGDIVREVSIASVCAGCDESQFDWGYVARSGDLLLGSAVRAGAAYRDWWGSENWYDQRDGPRTGKVAAEALFALDADSGQKRWQRSGRGLILHATLSITPRTVSFVETRTPSITAAAERRIDDPALFDDLVLVCLERDSGSVRFEQRLELRPGPTALYLVAADDRLVLSCSGDGSIQVQTFLLEDGTPSWTRDVAWEADHHGKHLAHPAVAEGRVFLRPAVLDLRSGEALPYSFPVGHTCSSYSLTERSVLLRAGSFALWCPEEAQVSRWPRLRPDCWISTVPALGMLLSPEGGGGCSCGQWMETSIGFGPNDPR